MKELSPKALVTSVAMALVICSSVMIANNSSKLGTSPTIQEVVRLSLTIALSILLVRGWNPSRWISIVLLWISVTIALISTLYFLANGYFPTVIILLGSVHAACLFALQSSIAKRHFKVSS